MSPARTGRSGNEGAEDEAAEEGPSSANPTVHQNVLVLLQFGPVVLGVPEPYLAFELTTPGDGAGQFDS